VDFYRKISFIKESKNSLTLSNKKLLKKIDIRPLEIELKNFVKIIYVITILLYRI